MFNLDVAGREEEKNKSRSQNLGKEGFFKNFDIQSVPMLLVLALVFLLPAIFLPVSVSALPSVKISLIYLVVFVSAILLLVSNIKKERITIPWNLLGLSVVLVPLVYVLAGVFSSHIGISFFGRDMALDSVVSMVTLFTLLFLTVFALEKKKYRVMYLYSALFLASFIVSVFQILHILIPVLPSSGFFNSSITTTLGKWNDLGLFATVIVMLSVITIDQIKLIKPVKIFLYLTFITNLFLIILVNLKLSWYILVVFAITYFVYQLIDKKEGREEGEEIKKKNYFSKLSIIVFVISVLLLVTGGSLGNNIATFFNVAHIEAKPNLNGTLEVTKNTLAESPLLGSGPATFEAQWPKYRPLSVLETAFWNNDFRYGFGFVPSFAATTGVLGILTWLFLFIMILFYATKAFAKKTKDSSEKFIILSSFVGTFSLWIITIFYLPSAVLLALTFIFTGIFIDSLYGLRLLKTREVVVRKEGKSTIVFTLINIALILVVILVGYKMGTKFVAQSYFQQSVVGLTQTSNTADVENSIFRASEIDPVDTYFRSIAEINIAKLEALLLSANNGEDISQEDARLVANNVIGNYDKAIDYDPNNYNNYIGLANFYRGLTQLGTDGVYETAKSFYGRALELKPNNPLVYLEAARLEVIKGDRVLSRTTIDKALELKPNYSEAAFFVAQLEIDSGRTDQALRVLEKLSNKNPNDPTVFFQLGVLNYNLENYESSVRALEQSIRLNPGFQNARYFLGLGYYRTSEIGKAINQFERLLSVNPRNEEIILILKNLNNGDDPFTGADELIKEPTYREELPLEDTIEDELDEEVVVEEE